MKFLKLLCLCIFVHSISSVAKEINITLTEAMKQNLISVIAFASGESYNNNGLSLKIENKGKKTINIAIEPGLLFVSIDTSYQDLLIAGNLKTTLEPLGSKILPMQSYCAKSYAAPPAKDIKYDFKKQADSNIIKTLTYIKSHNIDAALSQKAIWVWTNHKDLNTVYEPSNNIASRSLILFLATLTGKSLPDYYTYFELQQTPDAPSIPLKPLRIYATFKWTMQEAKALTLAVYSEDGAVIQKMFENQLFKAGGYELDAKFESANVPPGKYNIRLSSPAGTIKETIVTID